jgi:hypothetical protein
VNRVATASGPSIAVPLVACDPLHPPEAVHAVVFVDDQVNVVLLPWLTSVGDAWRVTVGAGEEPAATLTVTFFCTLPPVPVQLRS